MKKIILVFVCVLSLFAFGKCKRCNDKGYFEEYWMCPLCRGYYFISPAWFDLSTGNTRWTETTYFTGLQTKSDVRTKMFSFKKCPLCEHSMKKGGLKFIYICACENRVKMKPQVELAKKELFKLCKKVKITSIGSEKDFKMNDWRALNAWFHLKKSSARGAILRKLVYQYTSEDFFDIEAADYKRDESKYRDRIFSQTDDETAEDGSWVSSINANSEENKEDNKSDESNDKSTIDIDSSKMNPTLFKASMSRIKLKEYTFENCSCKLDDYFNYEYRDMEEYYWSIDINIRFGNNGFETFHGYVKKNSNAGKKLFSIISDGETHSGLTLTLAYSKKATDARHVGIVSIK